MRKLILLSSVLLSGCYSLQGPPQVINARGVVNTGETSRVIGADTGGARGKASPTPVDHVASLHARFVAAARAVELTGSARDFTAYRDAGFALVYANCNDFFWTMGQQQTSMHILRDAVAPVSTLLTGIIALHDFTANPGRKQNLVQALALGSGATLAAIDIYQANFLFGADNIDSVRELTLKALSVHSREAGGHDATTFEQATIHIIDNQALCTPPHILALAKAAIEAGEVTPAPARPVTPSANSDKAQLQTLGTIAKVPFGQLTADQLGALWSVLSGEAGKDLWPDLYAKLSGLDGMNPLVKTPGVGGAADTYAPNPAWTAALSGQAQTILNGLSSATLEGFRAVLAAKRATPGNAMGNFVLVTPPGQFDHIDVKVS